MAQKAGSLARLLTRSMSSSVSYSTKMDKSNLPQPGVRLVLFDVFDTLCTPRIPIHEQYYEEALKAGVSKTSITPESVRAGFRPAFKSMDIEHPLYGKHGNPPISPEEWWTELIRRCVKEAGADQAEIEQYGGIAANALMKRFESDHGYIEFPETIETLNELKALGIKTGVVSNADPRILKTLEALGILPLLTYPPVLSWDVGAAKPSCEIFERACEVCEEEPGQGVMMVGDELKADYSGAMSAGLDARLIRRVGKWSDGAARIVQDDLSGIQIIGSLRDIVDEICRRQGSHIPLRPHFKVLTF